MAAAELLHFFCGTFGERERHFNNHSNIGSNTLNPLTAMKDQDRISPYNIIQ